MIDPGGLPRIAADVLARPRLTGALDRLLPLTVLRAPHGFGKTTLAAQWVAGLPPATAAWVSVERDGTTAADLWRLVGAALVDEGGDDGLGRLRAQLSGPGQPVVLVVDDLDRVTDVGAVTELLGLLRRSPRLHLVATGAGNLLEQATWLDLDGQVLGAEDLALDAPETAALLDLLGAGADDVPEVARQLGGWPLAVRAYALARRHQSPAEALRTVHDQLAGTIAQELADLDEDLVLTTAVLGEVELSVLPSLLADDGIAQGAGQLVARGFVTRTDGDRIRWPEVVRDVLLESHQRRGRSRLRRIRQEVSARLRARGEHGLALQLAADAEDWPVVRELLENGPSLVIYQHWDTVKRVITEAPAGALGESTIIRAYYEIFYPGDRRDGGLLDEIPHTDEGAAELVRRLGPPPICFDLVITVMWRYRFEPDLDSALEVAARTPRIIEAAKQAYPDLPVANGPGMSLQCGLTYLHAGDVRPALAWMERAHRYSPSALIRSMPRDTAAKSALVHAFLGEHAQSRTWLGRFEAAPAEVTAATPMIEAAAAAARALDAVAVLDREAALEAAEGLAALQPLEELWVLMHHARSKVAVLWGHPATALRELDAWAAVAVPQPSAYLADVLLATRVDLYLARGLGARCVGLLADSSSHAPVVEVRRARIALLAGDAESAVQHARTAAEHQRATPATDLEALVVEAVALHRLGDPLAGTRLGQALAIAGRRLDAFALVPRADLLAVADQVPGARAVLEDPLLVAVGERYPAALTITELTQRERVVLEHLAAGLTLQAIAHRETVSINTVKSQVKSLYRKLGAPDREAALRNAAREGLV